MSFLRGSANYVWCTTSVLGKGATGAVYQGVNKYNGEAVAVKTFNQMSHMRPVQVQMREFEVLKRVRHENIVKLLAIEDDQEDRGKVIVMELCTGGSLFNLLDDPENSYGLPAQEFRLVLEHLTSGIKHLRDNCLVHRDLKPGNIMKFISEDGQTIYKLTDFGAARELKDNQPFVSLYGTEEYLHPDMYERAVLRRSVNTTFTANVDLWSIGVTLFHVATGNLPFRPYGGRRNKATMHRITTEKAAGVISGSQLSEDGPIEYSNVLPAHCHLSSGLQELVTPLLAGLLEESQERMWMFDQYFETVTNILSKKVVHVFYMNKSSSIEVYADEDDVLYNFKEHIKLQTDVQPESQILLLGSEHLEKKVDASTLVRGYPKTDVDSPIFLYSTDNNNVIIPNEPELPKFPSFPNSVSVENDASLAKVGCSVGHECKRRIEKYSRMDRLLKVGVNEFIEMLKYSLIALVEKTKHLGDMTAVVAELSETVSVIGRNTDCSKDMSAISSRLESLKLNVTSGIIEPTYQLHRKFVVDESLNAEWKSAIRDKKCPCKTRSVERAKHLTERLRDSWQHLLRDRATRQLTYNDEQFHALEKIKVAETGKRIKSLLNDDVRPVVAQIAECVADWYKHAQTIYVKVQYLEKDSNSCSHSLAGIHDHIFQIKEDLRNDDGEIQNIGANAQVSPQFSLCQETHNYIRNALTNAQDIGNILRENAELIQLLQQLGQGDDILNSIDHSRL